MTNKKIAEQYAHHALKGEGSHLFIEGDTIYSYGHHFPIATRLKGGIYLFNASGYSNTTRRHKSRVLTALMNMNAETIEATTQKSEVWPKALEIDMDYLVNKSNECIAKAGRAQSGEMKKIWMDEAHEYAHMADLAKSI